ncbi:serine hydrolase [Chitinolyticbacter albus]|uniref:serine hydrolase n=1 Tax=Chitinolyticbacter albus TaxID=2961951 RepID=UPI002108BCC9|nr:serine hydrolase [Chitinolyticbacter albus]
MPTPISLRYLCGALQGTLVVALMLLAPHFTQAQMTDAELKQLLKQRVDQAQQTVGIVVGRIDGDGEHIIAYGKAAVAGPDVDASTQFEIGSLTKTFTGLLLADMIENREVKGDDAISLYLPQGVTAPSDHSKPITLLDLATHTSGLPRLIVPWEPKNPNDPYADYTAQQLYAFLSSYTLTRPIGTQFEYSNYGVALLGLLLANQKEMGFDLLLQQRILQPLGMTTSFMVEPSSPKNVRAQGHDVDLQATAPWHLGVWSAAGGLLSNGNDLMRYMKFNLGLSDVSPRLAKAAKAAQQPMSRFIDDHARIGMGWHISQALGKTLVWHNGQTGGQRSIMMLDPAAQKGVFALWNSTNDLEDIARHLIDDAYPLAKQKVPQKIDADSLAVYVGTYAISPFWKLKISEDKGGLYLKSTGQERHAIYLDEQGSFYQRVADAKLEFAKNEKGLVIQLTLRQDGKTYIAKRIE